MICSSLPYPLTFIWIWSVFQERYADCEMILRQKKAVQKIRMEFEEQGVEFEEFWENVGGVESMPGMEIAA